MTLVEAVIPPRQFDRVSLHSLGDDAYQTYLQFAQTVRPSDNIIPAHRIAADNQHKLATSARSFSTIIVNGLKYGRSTHHRGRKSCFAYFDGRRAAQIDEIYELELSSSAPIFCCVVRPFKTIALTGLPWER